MIVDVDMPYSWIGLDPSALSKAVLALLEALVEFSSRCRLRRGLAIDTGQRPVDFQPDRIFWAVRAD